MKGNGTMGCAEPCGGGEKGEGGREGGGMGKREEEIWGRGGELKAKRGVEGF